MSILKTENICHINLPIQIQAITATLEVSFDDWQTLKRKTYKSIQKCLSRFPLSLRHIILNIMENEELSGFFIIWLFCAIEKRDIYLYELAARFKGGCKLVLRCNPQTSGRI